MKRNKDIVEDIDFKSIAKNLNGMDDVSNLMGDLSSLRCGVPLSYTMKQLINEMLQSELENHLENSTTTSKNGSYSKRVKSDIGTIEIDVPRDRKSEYKPKLVPKGVYTINGLDEKIISMYARGMSQRDIVLLRAGFRFAP